MINDPTRTDIKTGLRADERAFEINGRPLKPIATKPVSILLLDFSSDLERSGGQPLDSIAWNNRDRLGAKVQRCENEKQNRNVAHDSVNGSIREYQPTSLTGDEIKKGRGDLLLSTALTTMLQ